MLFMLNITGLKKFYWYPLLSHRHGGGLWYIELKIFIFQFIIYNYKMGKEMIRYISTYPSSISSFPKTVVEAIDRLRLNLPVSDLAYLKTVPAASVHNSLGRMIRNEFGLFQGNDSLINDAEKYFIGYKVVDVPGHTHIKSSDGSIHMNADTVSNIIIEQLQEKLALENWKIR